jgi:phage gpG-like protein
MIDISLNDLNKLTEKMAALPDAVNAMLLTQSQSLAAGLVQNVRDDRLSGQVLQEKTGLLKDSIASLVEGDDNGVTANIFVDGDVPYAAIQEYGGETKAHIIEAGRARALAFNWAGKQAFFRCINHPGSVIPAHEYLESALADMQDDIADGMADAAGQAITG